MIMIKMEMRMIAMCQPTSWASPVSKIRRTSQYQGLQTHHQEWWKLGVSSGGEKSGGSPGWQVGFIWPCSRDLEGAAVTVQVRIEECSKTLFLLLTTFSISL